MMNQDRLAGTFRDLVEIDSVSRKEGKIAAVICNMLKSMGAHVFVDDAGKKTGSNTGNIVAGFPGNMDEIQPLLLNAHIDTVQPGENIKVLFSDNTFRSDQTTILAADDKSAVAILLEALLVCKEQNVRHGPIELVFTICEEIGLLGAKHLDYSRITARYGYCVDATDVDGIVTRAPAANRLRFDLHGRDAHAGAAPERGINAIQIAAKAIAGLTMGRIDEETTANIGVISGGKATNIVPDMVRVEGEVRSHDTEKLARETARIVEAFEHETATYKETSLSDNGLPDVEVSILPDFPTLNVPEDHIVVQLAKKAALNKGHSLVCKKSGLGSDANIFAGKGILTGVLGTGMRDMHTVRESIRLDDMVRSAELVLEIIRLHAQGA
ncbi:MAG: M20/M25/M40 family metallo-hydrolase [Deltaproteobacteria bacterium]|jgi:tripeptide aminopeptidase|nr:M20/M25/M40 family metallo-hydrolase [Deltaproteobacteria bacterium]